MTNKTNREILRLVAYLGGTEVAAAKAIGVSQPTVHAWLHGKHGISPLKAFKIERMTQGEFKAAELCPSLAEAIA